MRARHVVVVLLSLELSATLLAHEHTASLGTRLPAADVWNAATAAALTVLTAWYLAGLSRLWSKPVGRTVIRPWQAGAFLAGIALVAVALLSPLDRASDVLFSAHMTQHEILMLVSAPLMVLGRPLIATLWALGEEERTALGALFRHKRLAAGWHYLSGPFTVLVLHAVVLWGWHVPAMFELALHEESIHVLQHLAFFLTAALFWWTLIHGRYGRLGYGAGVLYVFATALHTEILGALLTFDRRSIYATHAARTLAAGRDPVADQQFAGVLMWVPFGAIFVVISLALFAAWLGAAEQRAAVTDPDRSLKALAPSEAPHTGV